MTQNGVVTKLLDNGKAEVAVERGTACGGNCSGGCEACVYASRILIKADNAVYAVPGDRVILESGTGSIMGATALVYMIPLVFFFAALFASVFMGLGQGMCALVSLLGAAVGTAVAILAGRRMKEIRFRITGFQR